MKRLVRIVRRLLRLFSFIFCLFFNAWIVRKKVQRKNEIDKEIAFFKVPRTELILVDRARINRLHQEKRQIDQFFIKITRKYQDRLLKLKC